MAYNVPKSEENQSHEPLNPMAQRVQVRTVYAMRLAYRGALLFCPDRRSRASSINYCARMDMVACMHIAWRGEE